MRIIDNISVDRIAELAWDRLREPFKSQAVAQLLSGAMEPGTRSINIDGVLIIFDVAQDAREATIISILTKREQEMHRR